MAMAKEDQKAFVVSTQKCCFFPPAQITGFVFHRHINGTLKPGFTLKRHDGLKGYVDMDDKCHKIISEEDVKAGRIPKPTM